MKTIVVLYAADISPYACEAFPGGKTPVEYTLDWAASLPDICSIAVLSSPSHQCAPSITAFVLTAAEKYSNLLIREYTCEMKTAGAVIETMNLVCTETGCSSVIFGYADCPFYNTKLSRDLYEEHTRCFSEYCFADGYPYGLAPEILDHGLAPILAGICREKPDIGNAAPTRDFILNIIKSDINSFDIETLISPRDYRYLRLSFCCSTKADTLRCLRLYEKMNGLDCSKNSCNAGQWLPNAADAELLCASAAADVSVLKTIPAYYQIQTAQTCPGSCTFCPYPAEYFKKNAHLPAEAHTKNKADCFIDADRFSFLIEEINRFTPEAVISLSLWGEPLDHPNIIGLIEKILSFEGLSVLIETTGVPAVTCSQNADNADNAESSSDVFRKIIDRAALCAAKAAPRTNGQKPINWIISVDAAENILYQKLHGFSALLEETEQNIRYARSVFPDAVYPQFVRISDNEEQLETFYRKWKSEGALIIQKFDRCCGLLPDMKTADVSPVRRYPCWHLRREMCILSDGSVPLCRSAVFSQIQGNVFTDGLAAVWNRMSSILDTHINNEYNELCRDCDEYYTYNF